MIDTDGCLLDLTYDGECIAIGSGSTIAQSAYNTLQDIESLSAEEKLLKALIQACEEDLHVNYPVYIRDTANPDRITVFDGVEIYRNWEEEKSIEVEEEKKDLDIK